MSQVGAPAEEDLQSWGQHSCTETVPDDVMRYIGRQLPGAVSFVFSCQVRLHTSRNPVLRFLTSRSLRPCSA